jgi:hypothetical protein
MLNVPVAKEEVARAGPEVEAQPTAALVSRGVRQAVEVVDVEADALLGGGVLGGGGPVAWAGCAANRRLTGQRGLSGSRSAATSSRPVRSLESRFGMDRCISSIRMLSGVESSARCRSASAAVRGLHLSPGTREPSS